MPGGAYGPPLTTCPGAELAGAASVSCWCAGGPDIEGEVLIPQAAGEQGPAVGFGDEVGGVAAGLGGAGLCRGGGRWPR